MLRVFCLILCLWGGAPQALTLGVERRSGEGIQLTYELSVEAEESRFAHFGDRINELRASTWAVAKGCAKLFGEGIRFGSDGCRRATVNVRPLTTKLDRLYPNLLPIGDHGVFVHTRYIEVAGQSEVLLSSNVVDDIAIVNSELHTSLPLRLKISEVSDRFIYIGKRPNISSSYGHLIFDPKSTIGASGVVEQFQKVATDLRLTEPKFTFALTHERKGDSPSGSQADVTPGNMGRFTQYGGEHFVGGESESGLRRLHTLIHEIVHFGQSREINELEPLFKEGHAEALTFLVFQKLDDRSKKMAVDELKRAIVDCLSRVGESKLSEVKERFSGSIPYTCGLGLFVLSRSVSDCVATEERNMPLHQLYSRWTSPLCQRHAVKSMNDILSNSIPLRDQFAGFYKASGIVRSNAELKPNYDKKDYRFVMEYLVKTDCNGGYGHWFEADGIRLDGINGCRHLKDGMKVVALDSLGIGEQMTAFDLKVIVEGCRDRGELLATTVDGNAMRLICRRDLRVTLPSALVPSEVLDQLIKIEF